MKKITLIALMLFTALGYAQVVINTNNPDASSALEIESTTGGILIPRLTETQRDDITAPATGLMIYQTDQTAGFYFWDGTAWTKIDGVAGPQGIQGVAGADGADGVDGARGPIGLTGAAGIDGTDGVDGANGIAGPQGEIGVTGAQGPIGLTGSDGIDGIDGATGPQGIQGVAGADGADGVDGAQGPIGLTGAAGIDGTDGVDGANGIAGPQGEIGVTGAQGPIGLTGAAGIDGTDGVDGANGIAGPQGEIGVTGAQGPIGLTGAAGIDGTDGVDGANGIAGPQGEIGVTGAQGPIGLTGAAGIDGTDGVDGANGIAGPQGEIGVTGAQGPIGLTGAAGIDGTDGVDGANGIAGPQGEIGVTGAQGPIGLTGAAGIDGTDGVDGANGIAGPQGEIGVTGAQGTNGDVGPAGPIGPSAYEIWIAAGNSGTESEFLTSLVGAQGPIGLTGAAGVDGTNGPTEAYINDLIAEAVAGLQSQIDDLDTDNSAGSITDQDGNTYDYLTYGDQVWTLENVEMVTYRDGTPIPQVTDGTAWSNLTTGAWCYYNNDPTKPRLYNWYAVMGIHDTDLNTPNKEFAPEGWHVPTDAEWTTLENHLIANDYNYDGTTTENKIAKAMASTTGWNSSTDTGAVGNNQSLNNSSGFNAFPEGFRSSSGSFYNEGIITFFWSSTENFPDYAWSRGLFLYYSYLFRNASDYKQCGFSVRFVRD